MIKPIALAAFAAGALVLASTGPIAHADTTMTAAEICEHVSPGSPPRIEPFYNVGVCSRALVPGLFMAAPRIRGWMADNYVGSYPVDANDPLSDWVVPDGADKAPQDNSFRWKSDLNEEWKMCPPTCPSY